jgi:hypothetical protein
LPPAELIPVLLRAGVELPRGVLGDAAWDLARVTHVDEEPPIEAVVRVSSEHWSDLREAIGASLRRAQETGTTQLDSLIALTDDDDPSNPLALALAEQAGLALARSRIPARDP